MANKKHIISKRIVAILCCVAMLVTGVFSGYGNYISAQANDAATISLIEGTYPFNKEGKYINVKYSGIADCQGWLPFFDETFASNYMLLEGGLDFATLNSELPIMHLADSTWFQLFGYSSSGLAEGASFTILKGAKIPYNNTAGGTSTVILDADYTFTFTAPEDPSIAFNQVTVTKTEIEEETETISLVNTKYDFVVEGKYVNVGYSGITDFGGSLYQNFFNEEFSNNYVTYEGGLTYAELSTGLTRFCVETDSILQLLWQERAEAFPVGASFTICQGAPIPYKNTAGEPVTIPLDADYTFVFLASTSGGSVYNDVQVIKSTTFSINESNHLTSGSSESAYTDLYLDDSNVAGFGPTYTYIQDDNSYAEYIDIAGISYSELPSKGVKFRFILDGPNRLLRIENWGELRSTLKVGDYMLFKKGMPLYYTTDGNTRYMKATLDSDYIYMVTDANATHNQYFVGMVYDASHHEYKLQDSESIPSSTQGEDQIININFTPKDVSCLYTNYTVDLLENSMAKNYIDFAGYSIKDAAAMCNAILISTADGTNVLQFQFNATAVNALEVGDKIILKKGLPIVYTNQNTGVPDTATLDDEYIFELTNKYDDNGTTRLVFSCTRSETEVPDISFGLDTNQTQTGDEGGVQVANVNITDAPFTFENYYWIALGSAQEGYIDYSGCQSVDAVKGNMEIRFILADANTQVFQFRFGSIAVEKLQVGNQIVLKEGMPLAYSASDANALAYLDDTYTVMVTGKEGSGLKLEIVRGIVDVPETEVNSFGLDTNQPDIGNESGVQIANVKIKDNPFTFENYYLIKLGSAQESYIDYSGCQSVDAVKGNMEIRFILADANTQVFQFRFGSIAVEKLQVGDQIVLKKGMPLAYSASNANALAYLDDTYTVVVTGKEGSGLKLEIVRGIVEVPETEEYSFSLKEEYASFIEGDLTMINAEYTTDAIYTGDYTWADLLSDTDVQEYIRIGSYTTQELLDHNVKILFIPTADTLQFNMGTLELHDGDEIVLAKGMTIAYYDDGPKCLVLDDDYAYQVTERSNDYLISRIENYHVTITVDGEKRVDSTYREGSMIDVSGYANASKGKVMSIKVNGVSTQEKKLTVLEDMDIVIENRSDLCIVMFVDNGTVYYVKEYTLGTKNITLPDAPDMDGYDDSWETFELVNGVITVNAVHVKKSDSKPTVELNSADYGGNYGTTNESNSTGNSSPQTGDHSMWIVWSILCVTTATISVFLFERRKKLVRKDR